MSKTKFSVSSSLCWVIYYWTEKRIKEHIGDGNKNTYSLQLKHWFNGKYKITIQIYEEPIEVLQIIEDNLSYQLKPAFGKQGGNNKV